MRRAWIAAVLVLSFAGCDERVTGPDENPDPQGRGGFIRVAISCDASGRSPLTCRARSFCSGLYPFCPGFTPGDVTASVEWYSQNEFIADATDRGAFVAGVPGDTLVGVRTQLVEGRTIVGIDVTVSVYADGAIFPTHEISGSVFEAGTLPRDGAIRGATVQIVEGRLTGRAATTGAPPGPPTGFFLFGCEGAAQYCFHAVPPGTYRLRASAPGFLAEEHQTTLTGEGSRIVDFPLRRE